MAASSDSGPRSTNQFRGQKRLDIEEERKGLLAEDEERVIDDELDKRLDEHDGRGWRRRTVITVAVAFILLLLGGAFSRILLRSSTSTQKKLLETFHSDSLRSNGTHDFKKIVLILSIDGLRADYLDRGLTPHLIDISKDGLRAKFMRPIFPSLTFPNHWSLMTGLYAESHGIVANNFWDPVTTQEFDYHNPVHSWNASWWLGEPMWETAEKAGMLTANLMWPGPPRTANDIAPTYFVPFKDRTPLPEKLDYILSWIDLPLELRPQLITAYEPSLDQAGHATGPGSALVNATLSQVDLFTRHLLEALESRNLTHIVDILFVSDHGMADTSHPSLIYVDDIIGLDGLAAIAHEDGWPCQGLRFHDSVNSSHYLELLEEGARKADYSFNVYTHETMPERYHFSNNDRISPIYIVPKLGYALTTRAQGKKGMATKGAHGYDNADYQMHALFVARGPFSAVTKALHQSRRRGLLSKIMPSKSEGWHSIDDDAYVMEGFNNVEVYNLAMKLLGIKGAKTNGTEGYWDRYL